MTDHKYRKEHAEYILSVAGNVPPVNAKVDLIVMARTVLDLLTHIENLETIINDADLRPDS